MSLHQTKILPADYEGKDIAGLPDRPEFAPAAMKAQFDALTKEVVVPKHNEAVSILTSAAGAAQIGTPSGTVQNELDAAARKADVLEKHNQTPFAPSGDYHPATKKYVDDASFASGAVSSVFGRAGHVLASAGDYTSGQVGAYSKAESLSAATAAKVSLPAHATPDEVLNKLAGAERWQKLFSWTDLPPLTIGQVLSIDFSSVDTAKYRKFQIFMQGKAYLRGSTGTYYLEMRVNNDAENNYVSTNLQPLSSAGSTTPAWNVPSGNSGTLFRFNPTNITTETGFCCVIGVTLFDEGLLAEWQLSRGSTFMGLAKGMYTFPAGHGLESLDLSYTHIFDQAYLNLSELTVAGWEKGV